MLARGREFLEAKGVEEFRLDAELLVARALGLDRLGLFLALDRPLSPDEITRGRELLVRRSKGEPTAYILGEREFYGRRFEVGAGVLVPRPETELVVDRAREWAGTREGLRVVDVGTGSGCLAVTLALELSGARVQAIDLSAEALAFARTNAAALEAEVEFVEGDGFEELASRGPFDLVVSNPPYVSSAEKPNLAREVVEHEPALALFAPEGDTDYWARTLIERSEEWLAPDGVLLVELGFDQAERLQGHAGVTIHTDYGGVPRVLEFTRGA